MSGRWVPAEEVPDILLAHQGEPIHVSDIIDGHALVTIEGENP